MKSQMASHPFPQAGEFKTLVEILSWRAICQREDVAYTYLADGEEEELHLTYGEMDRQARAMAAFLEREIPAGGRAILLFRPGLQMIHAFLGCLYAGVVAVMVPPPKPQRSDWTTRFWNVMRNSQPHRIVTTAAVLSEIKILVGEEWTGLQRILLSIEDCSGKSELQTPGRGVEGETIALLQYSSGSTGTPNGVMVSHRNILSNLAMLCHCFGMDRNSRILTWLPWYHDMGLVSGFLETLYGIPVTFMSPFHFVQKPARWLRAIGRYRATISGGPNFAYELCCNRVTAQQAADLDLTSWEVAFNGAESVRARTVERFAAQFKTSGFRPQTCYPAYGLAEATLIVSGGTKESLPVMLTVQVSDSSPPRVCPTTTAEPGARILVGCGQPALGTKLRIVEPDSGSLCPPGELGEIWVSSPSVAQGYWNQPEQTFRVFNAFVDGTREGPFLRTGDLGFVSEGELFIVGRIKDLIIVNGQTYYAEDVEDTIARHVGDGLVSACAVFSVETAESEQAVAMIEVSRALSKAMHENDRAPAPTTLAEQGEPDMARTIRESVSRQHGLRLHDVVMVPVGRLYKTPSGKVQRHACRDSYIRGTWSPPEHARVASTNPQTNSHGDSRFGAEVSRDESC